MPSDTSPPDALSDLSQALQSVLAAIIRAERKERLPQSPLALLAQITRDPEWEWLRPLYQLIAEMDHARSSAPVPAGEIAAAGAQARSLLAGESGAAEKQFFERYRTLLQSDPEVAMAHAAAVRAARAVPPEAASESERLHDRHQWAVRCRHRLPWN